ncbi:MAG: hypothetical protein Q9164_005400 [Protoblastenia rupestris]
MPLLERKPAFTRAPETVPVDGILFDMDGTIIDSTDAIVKYWHLVGKELGVDPMIIIKDAHGRRSIDTLKMYDPSKANWEYVSHMEGLVPTRFGQDAVEIPGARNLLASLDAIDAPWAIVTSGTRPLVNGWLDVMKLAHPKRMVSAEDVKQGKPDPECYLLGKERLSLSSNAEDNILVVEDAPAGIRAGVAAGCKVIGLATSHSIKQIVEAGAHWVVKDLESVKLRNDAATRGLLIEIADALEA